MFELFDELFDTDLEIIKGQIEDEIEIIKEKAKEKIEEVLDNFDEISFR